MKETLNYMKERECFDEVPSKEELIHLKIQAAMRENFFETDQLEYLGERWTSLVYDRWRA